MSQASFPATRWTLVLEARTSPAARRKALEELLSIYWRPLYVYARWCGLSHDDAEDAVQGLSARLIESEFLAHVDPQRGRLRSYLRTAMRNFLANDRDRAMAVKRGSGAVTFAINEDFDASMFGGASSTPEAAFDRAWALTVVKRALDRLQEEHRVSRQRTPFAVIAAYFDPASEPPRYEDAAADVGISPGLLRVAIHRARARYRTLVAEEAADTLAGETDAAAEVGDLLRSLSA